jgi:hypothetical protein
MQEPGAGTPEPAVVVVLAGVLDVAAGTGLAYTAGFTTVSSVLRDQPWRYFERVGSYFHALMLTFQVGMDQRLRAAPLE